MKAFGVEIRKANSMSGLLSDVDRVLMANNIVPGSGGLPARFKAESCVLALQKMLKWDRHFSICTIRDCADVFNVIIPSERMRVYQSVHCVNWNDMESSYRQTLTALILDDFREVLKLAA